MRLPRMAVALVTSVLTLSSLASSASGAPAKERFYVIGFSEVPKSMDPGDTVHGAEVQRVDRVLDFARVSTQNPNDLYTRASNDNRVRFVEPDPEVKLIQAVPDDPRYVDQYGPQQTRAPAAWDTNFGTLDASVCVVDTGVRYTHEELAGPRWLGGTDLHNGDTDPMDDHGHGTHVAGIAAATINNATGIAGMANVGVYGVKVLSSAGSGSMSTVASGIRWCADNAGPRTAINLSLGGGSATVLRDAVTYAHNQGALIVAAAGNGGPCSNCVLYPAAYPEAIAVTCTTSSEAQCGFSSDGPESDLAAPGQGILSLWHSDDSAYNTISGTSMSTPHVAGAAALVWSSVTVLGNGELRNRLENTAKDLGTAGWDEEFGNGLVDAKAALDAANQPVSQLYFENFDDGKADSWTLGGLWHVSSQCAGAPSAPNYLGYNKDSTCDYSTGSRTTGNATFGVDLSGRSSASLDFLHRFEKENYTADSRDLMQVQVSTNGGSSYTTLKQWSSRNADQLEWLSYSIDLTPYTGQPIKLRFKFDSVKADANNFEGWFLDDVEVSASAGDLANQAPLAAAGPDQTLADADASGAESVLLDGSGSSDPDGTIATYEWREGDTLLVSGATPTISLPVGIHTITLTVTDDETAPDSDDVVITVAANSPPVASFTHSISDSTVSVDGSASSDPDGSLVSYTWDWGDGTPQDLGVNASHTYASLGSYVITLTVVDNGGASATSSKTVSLGDAQTLYFEDFDDGKADGWTLGGLWHVSSQCAGAPSAPNYLGYNKDSTCDYSTGSRTTGNATFGVDLSGRSSASLDFLHRFEKENYMADSRDVMQVQVSVNGGSSYTTLKQWSSRNADQLEWLSYSIDLTPYAGQPVKLRFRFDSVKADANDFEGWFLDDVAVIGS